MGLLKEVCIRFQLEFLLFQDFFKFRLLKAELTHHFIPCTFEKFIVLGFSQLFPFILGEVNILRKQSLLGSHRKIIWGGFIEARGCLVKHLFALWFNWELGQGTS